MLTIRRVEAEVEAFLFQCRATLDVLAKLLRPTGNIKLATFGDNGNAVIKALQRNLPKERAAKAAELVRLERSSRSVSPTIMTPSMGGIARFSASSSKIAAG